MPYSKIAKNWLFQPFNHPCIYNRPSLSSGKVWRALRIYNFISLFYMNVNAEIYVGLWGFFQIRLIFTAFLKNGIEGKRCAFTGNFSTREWMNYPASMKQKLTWKKYKKYVKLDKVMDLKVFMWSPDPLIQGSDQFSSMESYFWATLFRHPSVEMDLSLKIEVRDQTIWKSTQELLLICSIQMKFKSIGNFLAHEA